MGVQFYQDPGGHNSRSLRRGSWMYRKCKWWQSVLGQYLCKWNSTGGKFRIHL